MALWNFEGVAEQPDTRKKFAISTPQMWQEQSIFLMFHVFGLTTDKSAGRLCGFRFFFFNFHTWCEIAFPNRERKKIRKYIVGRVQNL